MPSDIGEASRIRAALWKVNNHRDFWFTWGKFVTGESTEGKPRKNPSKNDKPKTKRPRETKKEKTPEREGLAQEEEMQITNQIISVEIDNIDESTDIDFHHDDDVSECYETPIQEKDSTAKIHSHSSLAAYMGQSEEKDATG